jgi:hypothetical protein
MNVSPFFSVAMVVVLFSTARADDSEKKPARDSDPRINAVMERFDLTGPITDPEQRNHLLMIHKLMTTKSREKPGTGKLRTITPPQLEEGYRGVLCRLKNPNDPEQAEAASILAKQPMPIERLVHYAPLLPRVFLEGWSLRIHEASRYDGVMTVKAHWLPLVRTAGRGDVVNSDYTETWEIRGKEAVLVKAEATVEPRLSHGWDEMPMARPPVPLNRD